VTLEKEIKDLEDRYSNLRAAAFAIPEHVDAAQKKKDTYVMAEQFARDTERSCVHAVLNINPEAPLYKVAFMSEVEREGIIKDNLPLETTIAIQKLEKATEDAERKAYLKDVTKGVVKTGLKLMESGLLPQFRGAEQNRTSEFLTRSVKTVEHLTGEKPDKQWCKTEIENNKRSIDGFCTHCRKQIKSDLNTLLGIHNTYMVVDEHGYGKRVQHISKLQDEMAPADRIARFCSDKCRKRWNETLMCHECYTFEYTRPKEPTDPDPASMLDMTAQYMKRLRALSPDARNTVDLGKMWPHKTACYSVPVCAKCSATMLPRFAPSASRICKGSALGSLRVSYAYRCKS